MSEIEEKLTKYKNVIAQTYEKYSIIPYATRNRVFNEATDRNLIFASVDVDEVVPMEWFEDPAICPEPFFSDVGRNLTIGEENYLIRTIINGVKTEPITISNVTLHQIRNIVQDFVSKGNSEPVMFIPAKLSIPLYLEPMAVEFINNREFLKINQTIRVPLFLTSKYVNLNDLLLIDKSFGVWIFKQGNFVERLTIETICTEHDNIRIIAKTQVAYNVMRPEAARILHVSNT